MKELETEGKSVTLAVENGLIQLGLRRDQVEVEVLEEPAVGFLGLGAKPARVRIRERSADAPSRSSSKPPRKIERPVETPVDSAEACAVTDELLGEILKLCGADSAKAKSSWDAEQARVRCEISSTDGELIVGKGGRTLEALQFLATIVLGRRTGTPVAVQVEADGYWSKIEDGVLQEAQAALAEVRRSGSPYRFEPMEPALRRLLHRKLGEHPDVETASEGEGPWRKVVLKPRRR